MIRYLALIMVLATFTTLFVHAQEQIVYVLEKDEDGDGWNDSADIYQQILGQRSKKLTFDGRSSMPALSPDGRKIAYVSTINRNLEILVMGLRSKKHQQLTFEPKLDLHPTWSPDGTQIAFSSNRTGDFDIYIMDASGANVTRMTDNFPWDDFTPHWSPVSEKIVFTSDRGGGTDQIYLIDLRTGDQQKLTASHIRAEYPRWSPTGRRIAYFSMQSREVHSTGPTIWRLKLDGTDLEALVTEGQWNTNPKFSRDGRRIIFASGRNFNLDIYALNLDTQEVDRLTTHLGDDREPDWSPDGEQIVFISSREGNPDVFTMTINGGQLVNLTKSGMAELSPAWSPDGDKIAFGRRMGDNSVRIYVIDSNGENEVKLVDLPFVNRFLAWSPRGDKLAFVNYPERGNRKSRIYTVDSDGQNLQMLYENPEGIKEIAWSHDGTQILFNQIGGRIGYLDTLTHEVHPVNLPVRDIYTPDWSPNGQEIIFSARLLSGFPKSLYGIFIIDRDGNPLQTVLMDTRPLGTNGLAWSPGGDKILFGREGGLYTLDLTTEVVDLFLESASAPDWQDPSRPRSVSPRNRLKTIWGEIKKRDKR